jgi:HAD superfamily hydrolase (TIGR01509 family)
MSFNEHSPTPNWEFPHTPHLRALIFDMDGTLADTEEFHRLAFNEAFYDFGLDWEWTPELYAELLAISGGLERIVHYATRTGLHHDRSTLLEFATDVHRVKTGYYGHMLRAGHIPLRTGVRRILAEAREQKIHLAIATSSAYVNVKTLLELNLGGDWQTWFSVVATCDVVKDKKPSPAVYHYVLDKLGLPFSSCIAFEDTVNGLKAATSAHIRTIITTHYFTRHQSFPGAALVVNHLGEPEHPFKRVSGIEPDINYVNLALLKQLQLSTTRQVRTTRYRSGNTSAASSV